MVSSLPWGGSLCYQFHISLLMQGVSNKNQQRQNSLWRKVLCIMSSKSQPIFFPDPQFFTYPVPVWKFLFMVVLFVSFLANSPADQGMYYPWWPWCISCYKMSSLTPFQNLLDCCVLWNCWCKREVKVPSNNQVCIIETSFIHLENISSISHPDHAGSRSTSCQQAFCLTWPMMGCIAWWIQMLKCHQLLQGMCKTQIYTDL